MTETITFNKVKKRYEMTVEDFTVYATVRKQDATLFVDYVYAPPALRGTGAAGRFMHQLMKEARKEAYQVVPVCGYAATWLKRHDEYADLISG